MCALIDVCAYVRMQAHVDLHALAYAGKEAARVCAWAQTDRSLQRMARSRER